MSYDPYDSPEETAYKARYWKKRNKGGKTETCPTCKQPNTLTKWEKAKGYQCDDCADKAEGGFSGY